MKTLIVFGGTGGIGSAVSSFFVKEGFNVTVIGRNIEKLASFKENLGNPKNLLCISGDASNNTDVLKVFRETKEHFGSVDGIFISVGDWKTSNVSNTPYELMELRKILKPGLVYSVQNICSIAGYFFEENSNGGVIFHMSSHVVIRDENKLPGNVIYRELKQLAESVVNEYTSTKIRTVNIRSAIVNTSGNKNVLGENTGRAVQPEDIAKWVFDHFEDQNLPTDILFDSDVIV